MGSGFFNVGITGLNAAQAGMLTAGHNISNASTPGFNRQEIVQTNATPQFVGTGFLGQGTTIETVRRVYSSFLAQQVQTADTSVAELNAYSAQINQIDNMLADPSVGVGTSMQAFFDAASQVANTPSSIPARQALLATGQGLVARFQGVDQQLSGIRNGVNSQIATEVGTINSLVTQVADINQRIILAQAAGTNAPANDLLDQRDQLISDLNKEVRVSVQTETDGSYSVFFGSGQPLVVGSQTYTLQTSPAPEDLTQMEVALKSPNGQTQQLPESLISGGTLGGLLQFRSQSLDTVQNNLGRIALAVTSTVNYQSNLGQDLSGNPGGNFFSPINLSVLGSPGNVGSATVTASMVTSDYRVSYDGTNYNVTRLSDNKQMPPTTQMPLTIDGVQISLQSGVLAGTVANPDVFLIQPGAMQGQRVTRMTGNPDTAMLASTGSNLQTLSTSDFRLTLSASTPAGSTYTLTRLSDNQTWSGSGTDQKAALTGLMAQVGSQGFSLSVSNNLAFVGDSFLIRPTRYAARDMQLAITDPRAIAAATPIATGAAVTNAGTASITPGVVSSTNAALSASFNLRYEASSNSLTGFPVGSSVMVNSTAYTIASATTRIPYSSSAKIGVNGVAVVISGTLGDGDVFTVNPPPAAPSIPANTGLAAMFGAPPAPSVRAGQVGSASPLTPLTLTNANNQFNIALDGAASPTLISIPPGTYATPQALAAQIQATINSAVAPGVTVGVGAGNKLVVTSNTVAGLSGVSLTEGNGGMAQMFGAPVAGSNQGTVVAGSAPANPITITQASNDRFSITVDTTTKMLTIPAGTYTPATLAAQMQTSINAAFAAVPASVTVSLNPTNQLVVTSNLVGTPPSAVALAVGSNTVTGGIVAGIASSINSLPVENIPLTFKQADASLSLPDRLTGLPVGSVVTVTLPTGGDPTQYTISSSTDYVRFTSGATLAFNGISFAINGAPVDGDVFNVGPNASGSGDGRNILAIQTLQSTNTMSDGSATFQSSYAQLVSDVGNKSREIQVTQTAQENLATQNATAVQSMSGVNLDEEAANLMRYQQAYQASAKMLSMASKLFDTLLAI